MNRKRFLINPAMADECMNAIFLYIDCEVEVEDSLFDDDTELIVEFKTQNQTDPYWVEGFITGFQKGRIQE